MILFEHPLNEYFRVFLRLENLLTQFYQLSAQPDPFSQKVAIRVILEFLESYNRSDVKKRLLSMMNTQRQKLIQYSHHPQTDQAKIQALVATYDQRIQELDQDTPLVKKLREDTWLKQITTKMPNFSMAIPVEMAQYRLWQHMDERVRMQKLTQWGFYLDSLYKGLELVLDHIRQSAKHKVVVTQTNNSQYVENSAGSDYVLLRMWVPKEARIFPEVTANRLMICVSFKQLDENLNAVALQKPVRFKIALGSI